MNRCINIPNLWSGIHSVWSTGLCTHC